MTEPAAPEPFVYLDGQPTTRTEAGARHAELIRDPDFAKAAAAGDPAKLAELHALKRVELGLSPEQLPPATPEQVRAQMQDADRVLDDARLSVWERLAGMDEQQAFESRRGLATARQVADARLAVERMKNDAAFRVRVLNGDQDAVRKWLLAGRVATMQIASDDHDWSRT